MSPGTRWKHCAAHSSGTWTSQLISQWEDELKKEILNKQPKTQKIWEPS